MSDPRHETADVRPYTVTGGRTRSSSVPLPLEALVETVDLREPLPGTVSGTPNRSGSPKRSGAGGPEQRRILELADGQYQSIAELSAHLHLPLGVVRVLVDDLSTAGLLTVHAPRLTRVTGRTTDRTGDRPADLTNGRTNDWTNDRSSDWTNDSSSDRMPIDVDDARRVAETLSVLESVLDGISAL